MNTMTTKTKHVAKHAPTIDEKFEIEREAMDAAFLARIDNGKAPLFTTNADPAKLWDAYLAGFPKRRQQVHNCSACRHFIQRYGGLVTIGDCGRIASAIWTDAIPPFEAMRSIAQRAKVTGVFLSSNAEWGQHSDPPWTHLAVTPTKAMLFKHAVLAAGQMMAERREDHHNVARALAEYPLSLIEIALRLLDSDAMYRSEKVQGPAIWLRDTHVAMDAAPKGLRDNILWARVAKAPAGFCHPRASMIGTLLDDLASGAPVDAVTRRFREKMSPLQYQRPTAAPSAGNIAQAEKVVAALGAAGALRRRFARLDEVIQHAVWAPKAATPTAPAGGVFGHIKPNGEADPQRIIVPSSTMTWVKFARDVLPGAEKIAIVTPSVGSFMALVTACDTEAPPIIQWDTPERRNPVNWYVYGNGSPASQWGLSYGSAAGVSAILPLPSRWGDGNAAHQGDGLLFVLDGCRDSRTGGGLALFPEVLRSEFHGIRASIEAFSRAGELEGREASTANGLDFRKGKTWNADIHVTSRGITSAYKLDRWE